MTTNSKSQSSKYLYPLLFAAFTALGMLIGFRMADDHNEMDTSLIKRYSGDDSGKIGRVEELLRFIDSKYVDTVDSEKLLDVATKAIFNNLDPHSVYIPPEDILKINERMSGYYKGVGVETILFDDTLRITKVMEGSPASKSGLSYGDKIFMLQDSIVAGLKMPVERQWALMKVEEGKSLEMKVITRMNKEKAVVIRPEKIQYPNVDYFMMGDIAYINIEKFSDETYEELVKALESFQQEKVISSLILDLRNNPGGYLQEATKILNQLFEQDKRLLVYTKGKKKKSEYNTTGRPFYRINKLAVLINRNSASASEIIAGAIQDWDQGIIVGEQSFGKGLVQDQFDLTNGGSIRLTTARYFTPTGRYIQRPYDIDRLSDSTSYISKTLARPLTAQGGIQPDYLVGFEDVEMEISDLARRTIVSDAYRFIIENSLLPRQAAKLQNRDVKDNLDYVSEQYTEINGFQSEEAKDMYRKLLKVEIYEQLNLFDEARLEKYDDDVFVTKAKEVLLYDDIFADFIKD